MSKNLIELLDNIKVSNIGILGDLILDKYVHGEVNRISPEAPIVVIDVSHTEHRLGGAVNVANNISVIGSKSIIFGTIGDDNDGQNLMNMMNNVGINTTGVITDQTRKTITKTRFVADGQQILRVDQEDKHSIDQYIGESIIHKLENNGPLNGLIISDYSKGLVTHDLFDKLCDYADSKNIKICVDPKGHDYSKYAGASVLTPNKKEAQLASGIKIEDDRSLGQAAKSILDRLQLDAIIITLGPDGIYCLTNLGDCKHIKTKAESVFDVTGAGDTVISFFSLVYFSGAPIFDAVRIANYAAGVVVGRFGTSAVTIDELKERIGSDA